MGKDKTTQTTDTNTTSTQKATATPQELALNKMLLSNQQALNPALLQNQQAGLGLTTNLLQGKNLPGSYGDVYGGISPDVINSISSQAIADIQPQLQAAGLLDSGVNASVSARTSADIRNQAAQFNIQNLLNLMQLGLGGSASVQSPILGQQGQLSQNLAGLRSITGTGSQSGTVTTQAMNPFLKSFQTNLGTGLGTGTAGGLLGLSKGGFNTGAMAALGGG